MSAIELDVNSDAAVAYTYKLEQLSRSAFPVAVRSTLNDAAFDVKKRTLELSASAHFIRRSPNFFKRFSGVNTARGFNVNQMESEVGMTPMGQPNAQVAISNMIDQESGGQITRGLDYLKAARSGSNLRRVGSRFQFKKGQLAEQNGSQIVYGVFRRKGTAKSNRVASAYVALATGKLMKFKGAGGQTFYAQVTSIQSNRKSKGLLIKSKLVLESRNGINIKATHFMRTAALMTQKKMPEFYRLNAEKQFERALK